LIGLPSLDVQHFSIGKGANVVGLPNPLTFPNRTNLKIIALKMPQLGSDETSITLVLLINPQSLIRLVVDKEVLVVDLEYLEHLRWFLGVTVED